MALSEQSNNVIQLPTNSEVYELQPNNIDAEMAVLGGVMVDPEALNRVEPIIRPEMFYVSAHGMIYQAMLRLLKLNRPADLLSVTNELRNRGLLKQIGGKSALAQLHCSSVSAINIDHHANVVRSHWVRRQIIRAGGEIQKLGYETQTELPDVLNKVEQTLYGVTEGSTHSTFGAKAPDSVLVKIYEQLSLGGEPPVLKTNLYDLDAMIGGLRPGDLDIVAGRASMGKTQLGVFLAYQVAVVHSLPVVFFSAEMSEEKLMCRFLAIDSEIDSASLLNNRIIASQWEKLTKSLGTFSGGKLRIDEHPNPTPSHMRAQIQRTKSEFGEVGLVVLDYLQMLGSGNPTANRVQDLDNITKECKAIAKEFNVPFLALAQVNRSVEGRSSKRPLISDLRESGAIEQAADVILLLYRDDYYNPSTPDVGMIEIAVGKNRDGSTGTAKFLFDPSLSRFRNLAGRGF